MLGSCQLLTFCTPPPPRRVEHAPTGDTTRGQRFQAGGAQPEAQTLRDLVLRGYEGPGGVHHRREERRPHQEDHGKERWHTGEKATEASLVGSVTTATVVQKRVYNSIWRRGFCPTDVGPEPTWIERHFSENIRFIFVDSSISSGDRLGAFRSLVFSIRSVLFR